MTMTMSVRTVHAAPLRLVSRVLTPANHDHAHDHVRAYTVLRTLLYLIDRLGTMAAWHRPAPPRRRSATSGSRPTSRLTQAQVSQRSVTGVLSSRSVAVCTPQYGHQMNSSASSSGLGRCNFQALATSHAPGTVASYKSWRQSQGFIFSSHRR